MTNEEDRSVQERTDEYIRKYLEVKNGIKVEVTGHSNGKKEVLTIEIPTERGSIHMTPEPESCKWKPVQLPGSHLYLLLRTTIDGNKTLFLCKRGQKAKIVYDPKDLNRSQYYALRRLAKELMKENCTESAHKSRTNTHTKLTASTIERESYVSQGGRPVREDE